MLPSTFILRPSRFCSCSLTSRATSPTTRDVTGVRGARDRPVSAQAERLRFLLTPDITALRADWFEGLPVKPSIDPERVWARNTRRYDCAVLLMHEWLSIPGRNASIPA